MAEADGGAAYCSAHAVLAQHWIRPEFVDHLPSAPPYVEEAEAAEGHSREQFTSCSSPGDGNNADGCSIELVEDFSALDGEVGKRLNDMVPVLHVPKTNGEIPSVDEAFSDHRRLLDRLVLYGLVELKVNGDGNCQEAVSNRNRKEEKWVGSQMEHHACRSSTLFHSVTSSGVVVKVLLLLFPFNIDNCNFAFRNWWTTGS